MCADLHHVERAEVLAAQIVTALLNSAVDVRILAMVHGSFPFRCLSHDSLQGRCRMCILSICIIRRIIRPQKRAHQKHVFTLLLFRFRHDRDAEHKREETKAYARKRQKSLMKPPYLISERKFVENCCLQIICIYAKI